MKSSAALKAVVNAWYLATGGAPLAAAAERPLAEAASAGRVQISVRATGGSSGDTIELAVRRTVPQQRLELTVPPGAVFACGSGGAQNMVCAGLRGERVGGDFYRPARVIELSDDAEHRYLVEAYCLDFHKDNPSAGAPYRLSGSDARAAAVLRASTGLPNRGSRIKAVQGALWLDRERLSAAELKAHFPVSDEEIAQAKRLLESIPQAAGVPKASPPRR